MLFHDNFDVSSSSSVMTQSRPSRVSLLKKIIGKYGQDTREGTDRSGGGKGRRLLAEVPHTWGVEVDQEARGYNGTQEEDHQQHCDAPLDVAAILLAEGHRSCRLVHLHR